MTALSSTEISLGSALLFCHPEYDRDFLPSQIINLSKINDQFWEFVDKCKGFCSDDESPWDLTESRIGLEHTYIYSRLGCGTGLWDNCRYGRQLHDIAISQGRIECLILTDNDKLEIYGY